MCGDNMAKRGWVAENFHRKFLERNGWLTFRVSGSVGAADIIAIKEIFSSDEPLFKVELHQVKSLKGKVFYFDKNSCSEWERLNKIQESKNIPSWFYIYFRMGRGRKIIMKRVRVTNVIPKMVKRDDT